MINILISNAIQCLNNYDDDGNNDSEILVKDQTIKIKAEFYFVIVLFLLFLNPGVHQGVKKPNLSTLLLLSYDGRGCSRDARAPSPV